MDTPSFRENNCTTGRNPAKAVARSGNEYLSRCILWISLALLWQASLAVGQNAADLGNSTFKDDLTVSPTEESLEPGVETLLPAATTSVPSIGVTQANTLIPTTSAPELQTMEPTVLTASPTVAATTLVPETANPTFIPTGSPTLATASPTNATLAPTVPVVSPTTVPTNATMAPTNATPTPTMEPTDATTAPTNAPTVTTVVSSDPTPSATEAPTTANVATLSPTIANITTGTPTKMEATATPMGANATGSPTTSLVTPTVAPTPLPGNQVTDSVEKLEMTLVGLNQILGPDAQREWKLVTEEHTKDYYTQNDQYGILVATTTVTLLEQSVMSLRRLGQRNLQASVTVKYNQEINYRTQDDQTAQNVVLVPFQTPADLNNYLAALQDASNEFEDVTSIQPVYVADGGGGTDPAVPPEEEDGGLSTGAIIGIVVAAVVGAGAIMGVGYYVSQRGDDGGYVSTGKTPPSQLDVNHGPDEVSTLAEPHLNNRHGSSGVGNVVSGESIQGYGDQSVATVDYDYSKAYGGGGDTSVSSAGGTFGSQTHTQGAGGATLGGATGASNGGPLGTSFSESGSQFRGQNANVREELIDIYAPPGKLGVVIDTPDDGAPVVHAVKDSSVIADKLQVGDKLVAVDDEDVRSMTAIKVSKLISRKSANASRKLSIIRTVVVDE